MRAYERLLNYVKVDTTSNENSATAPTTANQFDLARMLVKELKELGVQDVSMDEKYCVVYASIPATPGHEKDKAIGFISHMDTVVSGKDVKPRVIENYDGKPITLGTSGLTIDSKEFPDLNRLHGKTLIVTDGTTVLGADDKAGIAAIMTMVETVLNEKIPHGKLCIGFTPDEETGHGVDHFDVERFGAEFAYTADGLDPRVINYETFSAAKAVVDITGFAVHTGSAKGIMKNGTEMAVEFQNMLPSGETPTCTEGYEGFYCLYVLEAGFTSAHMEYLLRDHDENKLAYRKEVIQHIQKCMNEKYGEGTVKLTITDQYSNMAQVIEKYPFLVENAKKAIQAVGMEPVCEAVRGGTDGSRLSYMNLPCPNIGTGGYGCHGPFEHACVEEMDAVTGILVNLVKIYAE